MKNKRNMDILRAWYPHMTCDAEGFTIIRVASLQRSGYKAFRSFFDWKGDFSIMHE